MHEQERAALIAGIREAIAEKLKSFGIEDEQAIKGLMGRLTHIEQIVGEKGVMPSIRGLGIANPFEAEAFKSRLNLVRGADAGGGGQNTTGRIHLPGVGIKGLKNIVNFPDGNSPLGGWQGAPERGPTINPVQRPLTILDVLPGINVSTNAYEYIRVTHTSAAAVQASEGALKAQGNILSTLVTARVATVAEFMVASRQVLSDNPQLSSFLSALLSYDVVRKAEDLIVNGNAADPEGFDGLATAAEPLGTTAELAPDVISEGLTLMTMLGYSPAFVLMHPYDFHRLRTLKAEGGSEEYMVGNWTSPSAPSVWNTPVVVSPAVTEGEGLIVDPSKVSILDRQQVQVMVSNEDRDNFVKNLVTILAEARFGLAIYDTGGVGKVSLPVPSPGG